MIKNTAILSIMVSYSLVTKCSYHHLNIEDPSVSLPHIQSLLDADIMTKLIDIDRMAKTIEKLASGGMVSQTRRLFTIKLAIRAILDGIEGDFLETVNIPLARNKLK